MTDVAGPFVLLKTFHSLFLCSYVCVSKERRKESLMAKSILIKGRQTKYCKFRKPKFVFHVAVMTRECHVLQTHKLKTEIRTAFMAVKVHGFCRCLEWFWSLAIF